MKWSICSRRVPDCDVKSTDAALSSLAFAAASAASSVTLLTLPLIICAPEYAALMLALMSWVAACWRCTAAAVPAEMALIRSMVVEIEPMAPTTSLVALCAMLICVEISSVALAVCAASSLTSCATTEKPLPASPALAASMVALSANKLVCAATALMRPSTSPILPVASRNASIFSSIRVVSATAWRATREACETWTSISEIDAVSSSVAADIVFARHLAGNQHEHQHCRRDEHQRRQQYRERGRAGPSHDTCRIGVVPGEARAKKRRTARRFHHDAAAQAFARVREAVMIELAQPARPVRAVKSDLHAEPVIEVAQGVQRIDVKRQIAEELETADGYDDGQSRLIRVDPDRKSV